MWEPEIVLCVLFYSFPESLYLDCLHYIPQLTCAIFTVVTVSVCLSVCLFVTLTYLLILMMAFFTSPNGYHSTAGDGLLFLNVVLF